jgi:ribosomal protein S4
MRCYSEKCAIDKKRGVPGISKRRRGKLSDFGLQLNEKQKVKKMYGMMEGQFRKYYEKASMMNGVTGHNLLKLLETRLDNVVYRAGFASSRAQARQIVRHGQILMNGREVNYINAHGTSTPAGDVTEIQAVRNVFGKQKQPLVASTKSLTGHSLGAAGVQEAIYSLIMMENNFISASANVFNLDQEIHSGEVATALVEDIELDTVLSNSFGFGGTNASIALSKYFG